MNLREITVGRDSSCDICLSAECKYASSRHAVLYMDGRYLMYRDCSTNGTMINNAKVHNRAVPIRHGDSIMLAGRYPLSWNSIERYFPAGQQGRDPLYDVKEEQAPIYDTQTKPDLGKFNWGAFFLYPLWGFFNGCWWAFLVWLFLWWLGILPALLFGICGTRWSWENRQWMSVEDFEETQHTWMVWGVGLFLFSIFICVAFYSFLVAFFVTLF